MEALRDFLARIKERKEKLGIVETEADIEAMRNKGLNRTAEKRALLKCISDRAKAAGLKPIKSYF